MQAVDWTERLLRLGEKGLAPEQPLTCTVVVITRNRPVMVRQCLEHLRRQSRPPDQTIVVDASSNDETRELVRSWPEVEYLHLPRGNHRMPASRNLGIRRACGEIVAFLDDDSMAHPDWLSILLRCYAWPEVGGAGGRAIDPNEPTLPDPYRVGQMTADGQRIDNFNAAPEHALLVDRVRGCNMSFRREVLLRLGGFDAGYTGSNVNEASDMCLRVRTAGYAILYHPFAAVDHLSAPREDIPRERRSPRTQFYLARNSTYLVLKNGRMSAKALGRVYWSEPRQVVRDASQQGGLDGVRWAAAHLLGKLVGTLYALGPRRIDRRMQWLARQHSR